MKQMFLVLILVVGCLHPLAAQYTRDQVLLAAGLSSIPLMSYSVLKGVESYAQDEPFSDSAVGQGLGPAAIPVLGPLPLFQVDPMMGSLWTLGGATTFAAAELSTVASVPKPLQHTFFLLNAKYGMFTTYQVYGEYRSRSDPEYREFRKSDFSEVTLAPFSLDSYANPVALTAIPLLILGEGISKVVGSGMDRSIFATGKTYFDDIEYNPLLGLSLTVADAALVAIQNSYEEAYWRGFVYEELKHSFKGNWILATLVNNALYALWHIPNQGLNWSIAGVFASGTLCTWAYELGGVPAAGAAHGIVNALSGLTDFALYQGAPSRK